MLTTTQLNGRCKQLAAHLEPNLAIRQRARLASHPRGFRWTDVDS